MVTDSFWGRDLELGNCFLQCPDLLGLRHGVSAPTPQHNVHQTATLPDGVRSGQRFFFVRCAVAQCVHRTGPKSGDAHPCRAAWMNNRYFLLASCLSFTIGTRLLYRQRTIPSPGPRATLTMRSMIEPPHHERAALTPMAVTLSLTL